MRPNRGRSTLFIQPENTGAACCRAPIFFTRSPASLHENRLLGKILLLRQISAIGANVDPYALWLRAGAARLLPVSIVSQVKWCAGSGLDDPQPAIQHPKHFAEIVSAPEDQAGCGDDAIGALEPAKPWVLFDAVKRPFGASPEYRKNSPVFQKIDRVVAPLAFGHLGSVERKDHA